MLKFDKVADHNGQSRYEILIGTDEHQCIGTITRKQYCAPTASVGWWVDFAGHPGLRRGGFPTDTLGEAKQLILDTVEEVILDHFIR